MMYKYVLDKHMDPTNTSSWSCLINVVLKILTPIFAYAIIKLNIIYTYITINYNYNYNSEPRRTCMSINKYTLEIMYM